MIISIIIPVYNVEKYVERCIRSCEAQDIISSNYEIICINDGSKDNSLAIIEGLAMEFSNISVITQPNGGLSAARNTGMQHAKGDYYFFLDSDDWIAENCLGNIVNKLQTENPDILCISAANVLGEEICPRHSFPSVEPLSGRDAQKRGGIDACAPFLITKAEHFKKYDLKFYEGIFHEDSELTPKLVYLAQKVSFTNDIIYYVRQTPGSITRSVNPKRSFDLVNVVCAHLYDFSKQVDSNYRQQYYYWIAMYMNNAIAYITKCSKEKQKELNSAIYSNNYYWNSLENSGCLKYWVEYKLLKMFPHNAVEIYKFLKFFAY